MRVHVRVRDDNDFFEVGILEIPEGHNAVLTLDRTPIGDLIIGDLQATPDPALFSSNGENHD